jgi:hypothetical protein
MAKMKHQRRERSESEMAPCGEEIWRKRKLSKKKENKTRKYGGERLMAAA